MTDSDSTSDTFLGKVPTTYPDIENLVLYFRFGGAPFFLSGNLSTIFSEDSVVLEPLPGLQRLI